MLALFQRSIGPIASSHALRAQLPQRWTPRPFQRLVVAAVVVVQQPTARAARVAAEVIVFSASCGCLAGRSTARWREVPQESLENAGAVGRNHGLLSLHAVILEFHHQPHHPILGIEHR